jgi:flagellar hook assembly protein FlgD
VVTTPTAPGEFHRLNGARPNPFVRDASIEFTLAETADVRLSIYDVAGRLVRNVTRETLPRGEHRISWDGRNEHGDRVAGGVYFVRLSAGNVEESLTLVARSDP